jgi:hypothetical protein
MAWALTPMQVNHRNQLNSRFPSRSKTSDGSIGDYQHTQGTSGHNPDDTAENNAEWDGDADSTQDVRAIDVDKDLNDPHGATREMVIQHYVKKFREGRWAPFRYIIYKGRIWRKTNGWLTETYSGSNGHFEHAHFSGDYSEAADQADNYDFRLNEVGDIMLDTTDKAWIKALLTDDPDVKAAQASNATKGTLSYAGGGLPVNTGLPAGSNFLNHFTQNAINVSTILTLVNAINQGADLDEQAVADAIAPMIINAVVPAVVTAVGQTAELTEQEVTDATEVAIREVFGSLGTPTTAS